MKDLFNGLSKSFELTTASTEDSIEHAEKHFNCKFPEDYKCFLRFSNGLEGQAANNYLVLWSSKELLELNMAYKVSEYVSDIIIFGSDGSEDAFGFDISSPKAKIVKLPFIGMGYIENEFLAESFESFLRSQIKTKETFFKSLFSR